MNNESRDITAQAAAWLARRDAADFSPEDEAEFGRWVEASYRHRVAVLRLQRGWKEAERLKALKSRVTGEGMPPVGQWHRSPFADAIPEPELKVAGIKNQVQRARGARPWWGRALAAGLVVVLAGGAWFGYQVWRGPMYQTPVGVVETVTITDGSRVTLNTDSQIQVNLTLHERQVQLKRGEAFFEVAKDPHRPFVVRAGRASVTAVGTQFSVRRDTSATEVVVTEGVVRVEDSDSALPAAAQAAHAGQVARITDAGVLIQEEEIPKAEERLSWRVGVLIFRDAKLSEAVADFNRYNARKIVIADPAVGELRVAGSFRATSAEAFVHLLEQAFPLQVQEHDGDFVLALQPAVEPAR